jgi:hypothetical protein
VNFVLSLRSIGVSIRRTRSLRLRTCLRDDTQVRGFDRRSQRIAPCQQVRVEIHPYLPGLARDVDLDLVGVQT